MKKNLLLLLFILIFHNLSFGQNTEIKNKYHVINMLGAKVYEKPNFHSKILLDLPTGESVIAERIIDANENLNIANGFSLSGRWIKPKNMEGFIFSSDLTDKEVEIGINDNGQTFVDLLGDLIDKNDFKELIKTEKGEFEKHFGYKVYTNGTYTYTAWDGCFEHTTEFQDLTLSEVYHQMVSDYGLYFNDGEFKIPTFQETLENIIQFDAEGATEDLRIELKEDGNITISSYDCT